MEERKRPLILVSNDDGVNAHGIRFLVECLVERGDVIVVAPDSAQSGKSSAITCNVPLRVSKHLDYLGAKIYSVNGTPVDCIKLAMNSIVPAEPDFIVAGRFVKTSSSSLASSSCALSTSRYSGCASSFA